MWYIVSILASLNASLVATSSLEINSSTGKKLTLSVPNISNNIS